MIRPAQKQNLTLLIFCFLCFFTSGCSILPDFSPKTTINTSQLDRVLEQKPDNVHALFMKGRACLEEKDFEGAVEFFNKAIEIQGDYEEAWKGLGLAYINCQDYTSARESMESLSLRFPDRSVPYEGLAAAWLAEGQYDECELNAKKALDRDPMSSAACLYLGEVAYSRSHYKEAIQWWDKAITISPKLKSRINPLFDDLKNYQSKYDD